MSFTIYAHAQIICDAEPCSAPFPIRGSNAAELEVTDANLKTARRVILSVAKKTGWRKLSDVSGKTQWLCPYETVPHP